MEPATSTSIITSALSDISEVFERAVSMVTGNPIAMVFIGFGIVSGGIALFRKVRHG